MQKMMIFMSRPSTKTPSQFQGEIEAYLYHHERLFKAIRYALADDHIAVAQPLAIVNSAHPKDAMVSVWYDTVVDAGQFITGLASFAESYQAYAVQENVPLYHEAPLGRVTGMCQVALLKRPEHLNHSQWLDIWLNSHTKIAIETQSTFSYRQNVIVDTFDTPLYRLYDAIVEEQFPAAAMNNRAVFFNAPDDDEQYRANEKKMIDSVMRFIDFSAFECVPMSEYRLK